MHRIRDLITNKQLSTSLPPAVAEMLQPVQLTSVSELSSALNDHIASNSAPTLGAISVGRDLLADNAQKFHAKAGTLTESVQDNINKLRTGNSFLLLPHQPNLFLSLKVAVSFLSLCVVAEDLLNRYGRDVSLVYLIIDHDVATDRRFKVAHLPDIYRRTGTLSLSIESSGILNDTPMWFLPLPSRRQLEMWLSLLDNYVNSTLSHIKKSGFFEPPSFRNYAQKMSNNHKLVRTLVLESYDRAQTLVEFNSIFTSRLVNDLWNLPIAFVGAHSLHQNMEPAFLWILENRSNIRGYAKEGLAILSEVTNPKKFQLGAGETFLWYVCDRCQRRWSLISEGNQLSIDESVYLHSCADTLNLEKTVRTGLQSFAPKVLVDNMLDTLALGKSGGVGYIGQVDHLILSDYILRSLGTKPPPEAMLESRIIAPLIAEICAISLYGEDLSSQVLLRPGLNQALKYSHTGSASVLYYLISMGFQELKHVWERYYRSNHNMHDINYVRDMMSDLDLKVAKVETTSLLDKFFTGV